MSHAEEILQPSPEGEPPLDAASLSRRCRVGPDFPASVTRVLPYLPTMFYTPGWGALLMASTTLIGTLGGVALTQWNQRRVYEQQALGARLSAIRENRSEQILKFMDAAQTVEEVAEERFYHEDTLPEGAAASNDQNLWMALGLVTWTGAPSRG